ncbi:MAG: recombinase family protein [Hylemonella sp.]|uniref:recombinase family protein n=1 Tax=Hylemonella sp. TaxID=2066020 RepID=UPI003918A315
MKQALIYARVSTVRQADDGVSMESQIEQCQLKAKALGVEVVQVFRDDGVSGRTDRRPGSQAAMAFCAANRISHFICWSTSRFGRNLLDALKNIKPRCLFKSVPADLFDDWMVRQLLDEVLTPEVIQTVLDEINHLSGAWIKERGEQRKALVRDLREKERRRANLYEVLEDQGKNAVSLAGMSTRLRELSDGIEEIQTQLTRLELTAPPDYSEMKIDPEVAAEMMREKIESCEDKRQLRGLLGTFVHQITLSNTTAIVEYREDALLRAPTATVHSGVKWLPVHTPLRTKTVVFHRPRSWRRTRRTGIKTG